jgi:selenocysteine lyase/cysteine desulfurase
MNPGATSENYTDRFVGMEIEVPTLNGGLYPYINLDNAASTPPLIAVSSVVNNFLNYYSSVHRGTGFKSQISTHAYETARSTVLRFFGADEATHICIFGKNTTEAINKLARRFRFTDKRNLVLTSEMEHHSNDLPWRNSAAKVIHIGLEPDGRLSEKDLDEKLDRYGSQLAVVAISGASNVTGYINPIHRIAEKTHAVGAQIAVDCAQLAPHRSIDMLPLEDPAHLDYIAISAHKMYAPFGAGALIGRRDTFDQGKPDYSGGGTVDLVTLEKIEWAAPPEKDEAGSPNTIGAVALAAALIQLEEIGMENVAAHEAVLTRYALERLPEVDGIKIFGDQDPERAAGRLGVIPFSLPGYSHFLVAAILGYEYGIGVRSGCFCAHPYILSLNGLNPQEIDYLYEQMRSGDRSEMPGLVRISFGLYNRVEEIDLFREALLAITSGRFQGEYWQDVSSGEFFPKGWAPDFNSCFSLSPGG